MSFDPDAFLAEPATSTAADFNPDKFLGEDNSPKVGNNWLTLYGGLDGMDSRLGPEQRDTFLKLDNVTGNPKQGRAQAINQAYLQTNFPEIDHTAMELNWPSIRTAYAKQEFGVLSEYVDDVALYGHISKRLKESESQNTDTIGEVKGWDWKDKAKSDVRMTADKLGKFWESINKPAWELPRAPNDLPDIPALGMQNPALAGAVYNGLAPIFEQALGSPLGIATIGVGAPLEAAAKTYPLAKAALLGMTGGFTALMGWGTVQSARAAPAILKDPNASFQDKATKVTELVANTAATLLGAIGTAFVAFEPKKAVAVAKSMEGKHPGEAAKILLKEAETLETDAQRKPVLEAAKKLEKLAPAPKPETVAGEPVDQTTGKPVEAPGIVTPMDNGGYFVTDAQGKLLGYAETATEAKALAEGKAVEAPKAEETGKPKAPAELLSEATEEGFPATYNLTEDIPGHPRGSTVSRDTLEKAGFEVPETKAKPETIGISNEAVNKELAAMGEEPLSEADYKSQVSDVADAAKVLEKDPAAGRLLVEDIQKKPRPLSSDEGALLLSEMNRLKQDRAQALIREGEARAMGDVAEADLAKAEGELLQKRFNEASEVSRQTGTLQGRALAFRNALMKEDFSLASMEERRVAANEGKPLTKEQSSEVRDLYDRLTKAEAQLEAYKNRSPKAKQSGAVRKTLSERAEEARARISQRIEKIVAARAVEGEGGDFITKENAADLATVGADYLAKGLTKLAEWSEAMVKEFGEKIRPHLQSLFDSAKDHLDFAKTEALFERRKAQLEARIEELKAKLEAGDTSVKPTKLNRPEVAELEKLAQERDKLNAEMEDLRHPPKTEDQKRLDAFKQRTEKATQELKQRIKEGDFSKKEKPKPVELDEEANRLQSERDLIKEEYNNLLERDRYNKLSTAGKISVNALDAYDLGRVLMTTGEFSFILRQGKMAALSSPITTAKALPAAFEAFIASPAEAHAINLRVFNHPDFPAAKSAKLHLIDEGARLSQKEELFASRLASKIPVIKRFEQSATAFMNKLRFDIWRQMKDSSGGLNEVEQKQLAMFVNEMTGRGGLGPAEVAAIPLGRLMFSPRFLASRIQIATGHALWGGTWQTRKIVAAQYAKTAVGLGLYYTALKMYFGDKAQIGDDPTKSDFGKIVLGKTHIDPLAGVSQVIVFGARTEEAGRRQFLKETGHHVAPEPFGQDYSDTLVRFARSKLHPIPGTTLNLLVGKDLVGNNVTLAGQAAQMAGPMTYVDIYQAFKEQGIDDATAIGLLGMLGEGINTYQKKSGSAPTTSR